MWAYDYDLRNPGDIFKEYDQDMIMWAYDYVYDFRNPGGIFKDWSGRTWEKEHNYCDT